MSAREPGRDGPQGVDAGLPSSRGRGLAHDPLDLAFVADALLGLCARDPLAPFHTEEAWASRERRSERRGPSLEANPSMELAAKIGSPLLAGEVGEIVAAAGLTRAQSEAFELRLMGHTFEEIGRVRSTTKQGAMSVFAKGLRKVAASLATYPYHGLSEAYAAGVSPRQSSRRNRR